MYGNVTTAKRKSFLLLIQIVMNQCNELEQESFNSLYSCKCLKNRDFTAVKDKNVFHYTPVNNREYEKTSLADTNNFLESFTIQPNFDHFQTHDFHMSYVNTEKKTSTKQFQHSAHKHDDLEMLMNNLEHNFSVIALSETWTSKQETNI